MKNPVFYGDLFEYFRFHIIIYGKQKFVNGIFDKKRWIIMNLPQKERGFPKDFFLPETLWTTRSDTTPLYAERFRGPRSSAQTDRHGFYELTVVLHGTGKLHIGTAAQELAPDAIVLLPPGTPHREEAENRLDTIWIGFQSALPELKGIGPFFTESRQITEKAAAYWKLSALRAPGTGFELDGELLALTGTLLRHRTGTHVSWQRNVFDYLDSHCHEDCSISVLARRFRCSESYFHRRFRALTGTSPNEYLIRLRLKKVMFHLRHTALPLCEIAPLCGFSDPYYLSRLFHKRSGMTVSEFRGKKETAT